MAEVRRTNDSHSYHLFFAARADLLRGLGRFAEATTEYQCALAFVRNEPERRYLDGVSSTPRRPRRLTIDVVAADAATICIPIDFQH